MEGSSVSGPHLTRVLRRHQHEATRRGQALAGSPSCFVISSVHSRGRPRALDPHQPAIRGLPSGRETKEKRVWLNGLFACVRCGLEHYRASLLLGSKAAAAERRPVKWRRTSPRHAAIRKLLSSAMSPWGFKNRLPNRSQVDQWPSGPERKTGLDAEVTGVWCPWPLISL